MRGQASFYYCESVMNEPVLCFQKNIQGAFKYIWCPIFHLMMVKVVIIYYLNLWRGKPKLFIYIYLDLQHRYQKYIIALFLHKFFMHIPTGAWKIWIIIKMFYEFWWITYCYIKIKMLPIRSNDSCCWYGNMRIISFTNSWRDHVQYFTLYNLPFF